MKGALVPEFVACLREGYTFRSLWRDLMAGVIVGIVALPLAIAFGIASGVSPAQGLYTAIIAGFVISALSGSRVQIGGPTGAFIVVVFAIVQEHGYDGLAQATLMAGVLLMVMGFARLGGVIKFIPYPMTVGFTSGIALIIAVSQIKDFLGLSMEAGGGEFVHKLAAYAAHLWTLNFWALATGVLTLAVMIVWPRLTRKIPGSLVAILLATLVTSLFDLPVRTIGSEFGEIPALPPMPRMPGFEWSRLPELMPHALTIALLGAIESLLSAVVADGMTGRRHHSNMELVAQGAANMVSPLFGGIPATGAIARTATNIKNGGATPVAGMVHAVVLLFILVFFGRWAVLVPMASLAAVLLVVSYHMSEWRHFLRLLRAPKADVLVLVSTFLLTVFVDLTVAIECGVVLSALLFMDRMSKVSSTRCVTRELREEYDEEDSMSIGLRELPEGVEVFEVYGPFFFGAANQFKDTLGLVRGRPKVLILRMRHVMSVDATAIHALEDVVDKTKRDGTKLIFSGVGKELHSFLFANGLREKLTGVPMLPDIDSALAEARRQLADEEGDAAPPESVDRK